RVHRGAARACLPAAAGGAVRAESPPLPTRLRGLGRVDGDARSTRRAHGRGPAGAEAALRGPLALRGRSGWATENRLGATGFRARFRRRAAAARGTSRPLRHRSATGQPDGARLRRLSVRIPPAPALRLLVAVPGRR